MSVTTYTNCLRIERTDGVVVCLTELDIDLEINDTLLGFSAEPQTYISAAGYTPTNMQSTSDNAVNNADVEGVLSAIGVSRTDIIGGRYDFAKLHIFIFDYVAGTIIKKLGSGHWGEATLKDGSYVAEFRSLSQQLQQTIGRTYNPECDEQLGGPRCGIPLGLFPKEDGSVTADTSKSYFFDTNSTETDDYWNGGVVTFTSGLNDQLSTIITDYVLSTGNHVLDPPVVYDIEYLSTYSITKTFTGAATSNGTNNTFTDTSRTEADGTFVGLNIKFTSGANINEVRVISTFISDAFAWSVALPFTVTDTDEYEIVHSETNGQVNVYGANTSIVKDSTISGATDYTGMYIEFTSGSNNGEVRAIASSSAGQLTLSTDFDNNILNSDEYIIINMAGETYMALGSVTAVTDSQNFTASLVGDAATAVADYFNYGKLTFTNGLNDNLHMEVKAYDGAGVFQLFLPMPFEIAVDDNFQVFAGCDHRLETCKTKFNIIANPKGGNIINFQGFPYIPGVDQISKFGGQ